MIPHWILKIILGGRSELVTASQCAYPKHLQDDGFTFEYPELEKALADIVSREKDEHSR